MIFGYIDPGTGMTVTSVGGLLILFLSGFFGVILIFFKRIGNFFKKHIKPVIIILVLLGLGVVTFFIYQGMQTSDFNKRVVILGYDGLSPRIIEPLMAQGKLPNFQKLSAQGSYVHLGTTNPPQSPVAWTGFSTGQNPGKNGIFDFIIRNPESYEISLCLSKIEGGQPKTVIQTKRFWQYTSQKRVPAVIVACPETFPPDKIHGRMLSGMGVPDILGTEGTFSFYTTAPEDNKETTGGKVFHLKKSNMIITDLLGPKVKGIKGEAEHSKVAMKITLRSADEVAIEFQKKKVVLSPGQWSDWQQVVFNLGFMKKSVGIFKFYLVAGDPHLKLYVTPINMDPRAPYFNISYPKSYSKELADKVGLYRTQGMPFDTWALNEKRIDEKVFMDNVNAIIADKKAMLDLELGRADKGILYVYFESPDIIQHMFWRYMDPQHPLYEPDAPQEYKEMIHNWYIRLDGILGEVMAKIGEDDILMVLSDHGFDTFRRAAHLNSWLRDYGYLELKDPSALSGQPLLSGIDWSKTKAYALGFNALYLNLKGRERDGIVNPGQEAQQLKEELARKLEQWVDKKYDQRVINKVYTREEVFWGDQVEKMPDLLVGYNIGYRASWQTALGDVPKELIEDNLKKWSGTHLIDSAIIKGIFFTNQKVTKDNPSILDMAPTVLKIVGFTPDEIKDMDFDGAALW